MNILKVTGGNGGKIGGVWRKTSENAKKTV